jgi:hypothetical protein
VAVIQISKIQVRRGKKVSNTGVPQLSSAEFAWAIDSQELFIGNGSITEGAPYVGNTKILTEHDNILELAAAYRFASTDPAVVYSVSRSLQSKLDETVSVADFGAVGDGSTDCTAAFQYAFLELFRNTNTNYRKVLLVPNGNYLFTQALRIPSGTIIRGETAEGAVLTIGSNNVSFITADGDEISTSVTSLTRPKNVNISNLTISRTLGQVVLTGLGDSVFSDVTFLGDFEIPITDIATLPVNENSALVWQNTIIDIQVDNITFNACSFKKNLISVKCLQAFPTETKLYFNDCSFYENDIGVYINGDPDQSNRWIFSGTRFELIAKQAFLSTYGTDTLFDTCAFKDCGNGINNASGPKYPIVEFGQNKNNRLINCTSNRTQAIVDSSALSATGYSDALNASVAKFVDRNHANIYKTDSGLPLAVFDANNRYFYVEYFLKLDAYSRTGKITITLDDDHTNTSITDEYQYSPFLTTDRGGALMTNFEFAVSIQSRSGDSTEETLVLSYTNPTATGQTGTISYNISYGA